MWPGGVLMRSHTATCHPKMKLVIKVRDSETKSEPKRKERSQIGSNSISGVQARSPSLYMTYWQINRDLLIYSVRAMVVQGLTLG